MGDRLLMMFGVPVAHEDDARRAVRVALELRRRLQAHRERLEMMCREPLAFRIGLHTGAVMVGGMRDDTELSTVVGDVVSVAIVLQEQAAPGQILCSDITARAVQEMVHLEAVEPVHLPGQPAPMTPYAVLRNRDRRAPGGERWERVLSPFVGRERELEALHALLAHVEAGRGQVIGVVGEPGIGKSRLIYEFRRSLAGQRLTYLTGRCLSYGSTTPYLPVLDVLRHNCGIRDTDRPEAITAKIHRSLQVVNMAPDVWAPVLLHLLGVQEETAKFAALSPETRKARTLAAITQMCLNGSRAQPLILEIEDLHWIDASSDECLTALVERIAGAALLLLVTYRPGYRPAWVDKSYATQVSLQPLTQQDSLRVVQAVLPRVGQAAPLVPQLLTKAEGNPFFLEELARTVTEQGADALSLTVPDTIQAILMARIDRLPPTAKRVLQAAAVIGRDVALPLLQAITEVSEEAIHCNLRSLQTAEFLYETYALTAPVYTFKHVLTQEVTYQSLVRRARQQCHARIAQVLEAQFPEEAEAQPELLAHHYTKADRGAQAIPYWQRAGQRAVERSANVEAISHFTQALELLETLPETSERMQQELTLQLALGPPLRMVKGHTASEVEGVYTRAHELSQQVGDDRQQCSVLMGLGRFYVNQPRLQKAYELCEQCLTFAQRVQNPAFLLEAHRMFGVTSFFLGELITAHQHLEQGIALYDIQQHYSQTFSSGMDPGVVCLSVIAWALWILGYPDRALTKIREAFILAQKLSHAYSLGYALQYAAIVHQFRREPQRVQEIAEATIRMAREHGFVQWIAGGMCMRGWALAEQSCVAEGIEQLCQGMNTWRTMGTKLGQTHMLFRLAEAYGRGGQAGEGLRLLDEALATMQQSDERHCETEIYRLKGEFLLTTESERRKAEEAEECFCQALALARERQAKSLELRAVMSLCRLWKQQNKRTEARQLLTEIYAWFTEGFATPDLQEAKALLDILA
jgi:tetratricopeptide (TPR) repeat protein